MGWCHEFGPQIKEHCDHPMVAGESACSCPECGVVCTGRFTGCADVWARGPRQVAFVRAQPVAARSREPRPDLVATARDVEVVTPGFLAPEDGRWVLDWLRGALDGMRDEIHAITTSVARQQAWMVELLEQESVQARIVEMAEALPVQLGDAIAAALQARDSDYIQRIDAVEELREELVMSLADVQSSAIGLRQEAARLRALRISVREDMPTVADAISHSLDRADARIREAHEKLEALTRNGNGAVPE